MIHYMKAMATGFIRVCYPSTTYLNVISLLSFIINTTIALVIGFDKDLT